MADDTYNPLTALARRTPQSIKGFVNAVGAMVPNADDLPDDTGTIIGGVVAGYYGAKKGHAVLGAIAGMSLGKNLPLVMSSSGHRREALCNLAQTGASVLVSASSKKHPGWAFAATYLVTGLVVHYFNLRGEVR